MDQSQQLAQLLRKKQEILQGNAERIAAQRASGKLTARERISRLTDAGSFVEMDALVSRAEDYAGVITGYATVEGRPVYLFAQDFTVHGGAMGAQQADKICKLLDLARKTGAPVLALCDSAGVRVDEGAKAMNAYARIYEQLARLSGVCPILALVLGPVVGGAALIAQLADVSIEAADVGELMVYGPQVISAITGEEGDAKKFGGAASMSEQGGVALTVANEAEAFALAAEVLNFLPGCNAEDAPFAEEDDLNRLLPETDAADSQAILTGLADHGRYVELYPQWGKELRVAFAHVGGRSVGLVVSDAQENEGQLTPAGSAKAARFIRLCDCYSLPVVSLINSTGVAVPKASAQAWTMITSAQLLYAYAEATTAKVSVIVGNAIGQSYVAMAGKANADLTYAWPGAVISALAPNAAVQLLYTDRLRAGEDRATLEAEFAEKAADGIAAARDGMIDDVIDPAQTRKYVIAALEMLASKRDSNPPKKHGNMPL